MKHAKNFMSLLLTLVMILALVPAAHAATYDYPVDGGNLKFDPTTGTITDCDSSVFSANIPSEIYGVPVTAIGKLAFCDCKVASITIPSSVTSIGASAFLRCKQLKSITIPNSVTVLEESSYTSGTFSGCTELETVIIPGSIKRLPKYMFSSCKNLKAVTISEGVEEVGSYCFQASGIESIVFPDSVKSVESHAFASCSNLETVTFGKELKYIDDKAFYLYGTPKLEALYFRGNAPGATDKMINKFADGFKIYYPEGAAGWTAPTWNGYITESYVLDTPKVPSNPAPTTPAQPQNLTASGQQVDTWALPLVNEAITANLLPNSLGNDLRANITREQFAGVAVKLYEAMSGTTIPTPTLADNKFIDTSNADVRKAYAMGFVSGTSATTFSPNSPLTREQAAVMLSNVYKALGGVINARNPGTFADDVAISNWARNSVYFMAENGIISGVGNNSFDPQGKTQSQAALVLALRMLQNLK